MDRLFESLRPLIRGVVRRAGWVLGAALLLSALCLSVAVNMRIDTDFSNLIPSDYPSVQALERLRDTVGSESDVAVAVQSPSFEANKAFAEALIPRALTLRGKGYDEPYFNRVDYRRDTDFLERNALYFATTAELDELETYLKDKAEEAKMEANPFFFDLEEDEDDTAAEADSAAENLRRSYESIVGQEYRISPDSTTLVVRLFPTGSQTNISFIEDVYADLQALVDSLGPQTYNPQMEVTLAGRLYRQAVEVRAITNDVRRSFGAGVLAVLLTVVVYFWYKAVRARSGGGFKRRVMLSELMRTPAMALLIGVPLLMSLTWTFAVAYLAYGALNLMTSTLGLVLFGLGIDYGIHFYARYSEERAHGRDVMDAAEQTFASTGQAITVGALTTAAALYVLMIADFKGFSEFGFIAGTGVLFALVAMTLVMPALIAVFERFHLLKLGAIEGVSAPMHASRRRFPAVRGVLLASVAIVAAALVMLPRVDFEYQFSKLDPDYPDWNRRNDIVREAYNDSNRRNPAYILVDSADEVPAVVAALRAHMAADTLSPTIDRVESLQDRFPVSPEAQREKLARIARIRTMLNDELLQDQMTDDLARLRKAAQTTTPITIDQVPDFLRQQFTSKSGEVGNFVMVYPSVGLSDGRQSMAFARDVGTVVTADGHTYHAGSTSLVAADMLRLMLKEAPWMVIATFLIVTLLMWLNFRSVRWALLAMLPLVVGVLWMLALMEAFGLKLNFYNLVVLPAVLGIGNDAGAHMVHRYREEGFGSIRDVLRSTGEHVSMGAITTMFGFGGLLLSFHPGLRSIGELAVIGVGTTLLAALVFLPALLQWLEDRGAVHAQLVAEREAAPVE